MTATRHCYVSIRTTRTLVVWLGLCCLPAVSAFAQRELHWDSLEVTAHLNADGTLNVAETQTIVFTGDWNGGERKFNIRPRQQLSLIGVYRGGPGGWQALTEDSSLDDVDEYAWTDDANAAVAQSTTVRSAVCGDDHSLRASLRPLGHPAEGGRPIPARPRLRVSRSLGSDRALRASADASIRRGSRCRSCVRSTRPVRSPPTAASCSTLPLRYTALDVPAARDLTRAARNRQRRVGRARRDDGGGAVVLRPRAALRPLRAAAAARRRALAARAHLEVPRRGRRRGVGRERRHGGSRSR